MATKREQVKLKSTKSAFCYVTTKSKINNPDRISRMKYDPTIRQHVEFKETK